MNTFASFTPAIIQAGDVTRLRHDLFAFVAAVQQAPAGLRRDGLLTKADLLRLNESLLDQEDLTGVRDEHQAGRLAFLAFLARQLGLVQARDGQLQAAPEAADWFSLPVPVQVAALWAGWRDAVTWDDLRQAVRRSWRIQVPAGARYEPATTRRRALAALALACPPGVWVGLTEIVAAVHQADPAFLRAPDAPRWEIVDLLTGRDLAPARYWDQVEGTLLRYLVTGPLHWLGCISLGYTPGSGTADGVPAYCALTGLGAYLWGIATSPWTPPALEHLVIQPNFEVVVPFHADLGAALRLERLAEPVQSGPVRVYRLTRDRFYAALDAGGTVEDLLAFLAQASDAPLPQNVAYTLRDWAGQYGRVCLEPATILRTRDEILMQELRASRRIAPLLGEPLAPTIQLVAEENLPALVGRLREDGYMPRVRIVIPEERPTGRLHLAEREAVLLLAAAYALLGRAGPPALAALAARLERRLSPTALAQAERQAREWATQTQ